MKVIILFFAFFLTVLFVAAQNEKVIDSLNHHLAVSKADTNRVLLLLTTELKCTQTHLTGGFAEFALFLPVKKD